ncbi:PEP/pyruvate-binding domain-containing protein [Geosporobacter ferrireducens]|uniref:Phosphoenolpyruvate synthase n=1 Tax=Geosporobacter ferrireducens TaxID=1424294 RepID=A0A1D8GFH6_9FIRM|nr:PEP/pyruvate-binding domain-containing protein [Geosporobacter ferrireducens]AOT69660.1 hypothetical protein Gferi_08755 [Geosporobacter ferrireducens]MTI54635.1 hypothetical protein [Geosporobacter ferrireducens]
MKFVYSFDSKEIPSLSKVGGKAMSLMRMTQQGLPVPPGFVLSVEFFKPWFDYIKSTAEWQKVITSLPSELKTYTAALKELCMHLELDENRKKSFEAALNTFAESSKNILFAVRSSSPEEDLEGASFAGGYETSLGVNLETIEDALRHSFASSLDARVFLYKKEHGFPLDHPRIAVIVQLQVPSETAGVAFSLNPINNCYDEAVINANFGQGETVVSGLASPDTFVIDKVSQKILEKRVGKKETSIWLSSDGGTCEKPSPSRKDLCLKDEDIQSLVKMVAAVENYYQKPVDIEWAFAEGKLYLLQARPITAYIPLPEEMQTAPGHPKLLYLDETLAKQGIHEPLSVMGIDFLSSFSAQNMKAMFGKNVSGVVDGTGGFFQGRMYLNISNQVKLYGKKKLANNYRSIDVTSSELIGSIDENEYVPKTLPSKLRGALLKAALKNLGTGIDILKALKNPEEYHKEFLSRVNRNIENLKEDLNKNLTVKAFAESVIERGGTFLIISLPVLSASMIAKSAIKKIFKDSDSEIQRKIAYLDKALPNNITTEMGHDMYRLSRFKEIKSCPSFGLFKENLEAKSFSKDFMTAWESFMGKYGFRSPKELDIATPRYNEEPALFYKQLKAMAENNDSEHNPLIRFDQDTRVREKAFGELLLEAEKKGNRNANKFKKYYKAMVLFGGYREAPKYYFIMAVDMLRKKVLNCAETLTKSGRLERLNQVFDLTIGDLEKAMKDPSLDLKPLISKNTAFLRSIEHIREFPKVIDSRGKILRLPKKESKEGELIGEPISPGIVKGKVKVLRFPDEKPILPGDILVARATDPGWTPLFINAAGIILEVGGMLQHGALIAREYGKPCVSGIEDAVSILKDGQMVEIDGLNGTIKLL